MAKGIIAAFPEFASSPDLPGEPYQAFRNPQNTGFLVRQINFISILYVPNGSIG